MSKEKNLNVKTYFNIGYNSGGKYPACIDRKPLKAYTKWIDMLERCYSDKFHLKRPTYKNCRVNNEWHDYQNFAEWFYSNFNPNYMENWHLDKDILFKGNKLYSANTCCLVPNDINKIFNLTSKNNLPIGVSYNKLNRNYRVQMCSENNSKYIGSYNTIEDASEAYNFAKEQEIKRLANKWKGLISDKVYSVMMNFKI